VAHLHPAGYAAGRFALDACPAGATCTRTTQATDRLLGADRAPWCTLHF
jgi:hypothetical protein